MSDQLLTSLCTICHLRPYKYRCPRCTVLTCSLPCIKRHKQWAQCNGLRDPTVYVKAKDLATPKGIDHDYNYLTSIERELDNAEKNATSRGVILQEPGTRRNNPKKGVTRLEAALERCGVVVAKAPKGMTRSKQNDTRVTNMYVRNNSLMWTVEWVHPNGRKVLGRCPEDQSIAKAYETLVLSLDAHRPIKKRKKSHGNLMNARMDVSVLHDATQEQALPDGNGHTHEQGYQIGKELLVDEHQIESSKLKRKNGGDGKGVSHDSSEPAERFSRCNQHQPTIRREDSDIESTQMNLNSRMAPAHDGNDTRPHIPARFEQATVTVDATQPVSKSNLMFYLHRPSLPTRQPVLIPLSPDSNLAMSLANRLVLEFPTIYVLHRQPEDKLPYGFMSEEDFFVKIQKPMIADVGLENGMHGRFIKGERKIEEPLEEGEITEGRLLEVLGKDLEDLAGSL